MRRQTGFLARLFGLFITIVAVWMLVDEPRPGATAHWLYFTGVVALGFGLILTYAGFRTPPIVPGEQ